MKLTVNGRTIGRMVSGARVENRHGAEDWTHTGILRTEIPGEAVLAEGDLLEVYLEDTEIEELHAALVRKRGQVTRPWGEQQP